MEQVDVVVIGAGIIGSSIAWRLAQAGRRVVLLDRGEPGAEASSAAAGLLQPEAGREAGPQLLRLWLASLARYPAFVAEVREDTQAAFDFRQCGRLVAALDAAQENDLRQRAREQDAAGVSYEWLAGDEVRRLEPAVNPEVRSALSYPQHGLVDNARLSAALATAAERAGVQLRAYEPAVGLATSGGRVVGVETPRARISADVVVNCAGSWAAAFAPSGNATVRVERGTSYLYEYQRSPVEGQAALPIVRPAKGEIIALHARVRPFERIVSVPGGSISARSDGRIVIGATVREAGFDKMLTADGVGRMLAAATEAVPALREARFLDAWTGLRPRTPDDQPIIGADEVPGLFWATGHFKMGILSAPATADVVVSLVQGKTPAVPVDDLSPRRFVSG